MEIVYVLLPLSLGLAICGLFGFLWAVKRGQYEDLDSPQIRILFDNEDDQETVTAVESSSSKVDQTAEDKKSGL